MTPDQHKNTRLQSAHACFPSPRAKARTTRECSADTPLSASCIA